MHEPTIDLLTQISEKNFGLVEKIYSHWTNIYFPNTTYRILLTTIYVKNRTGFDKYKKQEQLSMQHQLKSLWWKKGTHNPPLIEAKEGKFALIQLLTLRNLSLVTGYMFPITFNNRVLLITILGGCFAILARVVEQSSYVHGFCHCTM